MPKGEKPVDFYEALRLMAMGVRVTKLSWGNPGTYGLMQNAFLTLHKAETGDHTWTISEGDLLGTDYVALPFEEALV